MKKLCFVIGPIGGRKSEDREHADKLLKLIIKPTLATHFKDYSVQRSDHISQPGMIDSQIISHLLEAELVIADLTTRNANAFYELGIRHMIQKPVIHVYRAGDTIPFDIKPYRAIEFGYEDKEQVKEAKIALRKAITEAIRPDFAIENPVTRSRAMMALQKAKSEKKAELIRTLETSLMPVALVQGSLQVSADKAPPVEAAALHKYVGDLNRARTMVHQVCAALDDMEF